MKSKLVVDELQLLKAIQTLKQENEQVSLADVIGVIRNCNAWVINIDRQSIMPVISNSQRKRIAFQLDD